MIESTTKSSALTIPFLLSVNSSVPHGHPDCTLTLGHQVALKQRSCCIWRPRWSSDRQPQLDGLHFEFLQLLHTYQLYVHHHLTMITGLWSQEEHAKFLVAIKLYPHGPWRKVAAYVGTRSIRQVQTHAQKYHEKVVRRMRGLHKARRSSCSKEHRIDDETLAACKVGENFGVIRSKPPQFPMLPDLGSSELLLPLLLDTALCPMSPDGVDSNGIVDTTVIVTNTMPASISSQLPSIDESLDFLIERLSKAGTDERPIEVAL